MSNIKHVCTQLYDALPYLHSSSGAHSKWHNSNRCNVGCAGVEGDKGNVGCEGVEGIEGNVGCVKG
jgi:hypothetical protein